ncbi:alkaline phosphatase [Xaviernesmea oryzae]|uniref:Alkaline phosphatase n=1 Tax=Xaviernesmea oryzae TaxID=464029 RepID=A0A1Q9AT78_9HYPH|nr:DedA family protein [Xaviernesmea oryzae]OLP58637.1 alkaline phosphatase [Xaviernesmea oryzae]SEK65204.1 membrane protein DedA, SNARE-associated domain [Xaviernesmea oryzae]
MEDFVHMMMQRFGAFGIALLMFLENVFPPIPSELIMPLAGYRATQGDMSIVTVILAGSIGSLAGILPWYFAGRVLGEKRVKAFAARHGRWLTLTPDDVSAAERWFREKGMTAVLFGRLVPTVRTLISVPAGIARMSFLPFLLFSALGTVAWTSLLALSGFALGQAYEAVEAYVDPVSTGILVAMVLVYLYRVVRYQPQS